MRTDTPCPAGRTPVGQAVQTNSAHGLRKPGSGRRDLPTRRVGQPVPPAVGLVDNALRPTGAAQHPVGDIQQIPTLVEQLRDRHRVSVVHTASFGALGSLSQAADEPTEIICRLSAGATRRTYCCCASQSTNRVPAMCASLVVRGHSASFPSVETSSIREETSSGMAGMLSRVIPAVGDHTRLTCRAGSKSG